MRPRINFPGSHDSCMTSNTDAKARGSDANTNMLLAPGLLIALGAALTISGIGAFMASGAAQVVPEGAQAVGEWMADVSPLLAISGYLSIAGNVAIVIGALMLAHLAGWAPNRRDEVHRVDLPGVWATLVFGMILVLPYDLALPRGLIPLAAAEGTSPVFIAMFNTLDLTHSVGLVVFYLATTAMFFHQARTAAGPASKWGWRIATGVSVLAMVVALGLVIGSPPVFLIPSVFLTWLGVFWLGARMAVRQSTKPAVESGGETRRAV